MAWRQVRTSADVDLDLFSERQLLQGLIDAGWISATEAEAIETRHDARPNEPVKLFGDARIDDLERARDWLRVGNRGEALIYMERFLGRDWAGILTAS